MELGDIEDVGSPCEALHKVACKRGELTYKDPSTGYMVFTKLAHQKRGKCCGSGCRHCPFDHENVKTPSRTQPRTTATLLFEGTYQWNNESSQTPLKILFFSGGKDSFLTMRALLRQKPTPLVVLLTTFDATSRIVAHQEIPILDIQRQAEHLDLTLVGVPLHRADQVGYVDRIRESLAFIETSVGKRINSLVFGDLYLEHIKAWREDQLRPLGFPTEYPLWQVSYDTLMEDLVASKVTCVISASSFALVKVGQSFDQSLFRSLEESSTIDSFGEKGEFHSLAKVWTSDRLTALGLI